uniref:Uncharacterized protein n=1 Tax=Helianthus annuus TaxID=4232 RepID=A0A251UKU8_HELAN
MKSSPICCLIAAFLIAFDAATAVFRPTDLAAVMEYSRIVRRSPVGVLEMPKKTYDIYQQSAA